MSNISVKFLIDKEQNRVLFAEAGSDFIDVLFSFLTLPLGSIVRRLGKHSGAMGSLDNLYNSVEQLDDANFQNKECKEMLLNPRSAAAVICEDLKINNIHDANPRGIYICINDSCLNESPCYYTYLTNGRCRFCGNKMDKEMQWEKESAKRAGIFVDDRANYIISDDLGVMLTSFMSGFSLVEKQPIKDVSDLEERVIDVCTEKALNLLRRSLVSKCALTEICFPNGCIEEQSAKSFSAIKKEIDTSEAEQKISIKIILNKRNKNVLYAEVGGEFLNQLVSFLTFPLGSVFRLLGDEMPPKGCISNLYSSAESLDLECFKSEESKNMVVSPQLASNFGCRKQLLKLDEMTSTIGRLPVKFGLRKQHVIERNPKLENGDSDSGGGYVNDSRRFLVFDDLHISPFSATSAIKGLDFPISDVSVKEVKVGKPEVLSLLSAMLISETVLTDVFSSKLKPAKVSMYM